jgi:GR25 family glycosyltransferase involved in LPS biosynthesis
MTRIKGFFINLEKSKNRRDRTEKHLSIQKLANKYTRFNAQTSTQMEAEQRGLNRGEYGLWKSWVKLLLYTLEETSIESYDYLHIIEDDAVLNPNLHKQIEEISKSCSSTHMILTDMYTNEEIWRKCTSLVESLKKKEEVILTKTYTGCLSSALIPTKDIKHIYNLLRKLLAEKNNLLPLDNAFRALQKKGKLNISCTLPFLTTIDQQSIISSDIQEYSLADARVRLTQQLNALLRNQLSVLATEDITKEILGTIEGLAKCCNEETIKTAIIENALKLGKEKELFRYIVQPRLRGQPGNDQDNR